MSRPTLVKSRKLGESGARIDLLWDNHDIRYEVTFDDGDVTITIDKQDSGIVWGRLGEMFGMTEALDVIKAIEDVAQPEADRIADCE